MDYVSHMLAIFMRIGELQIVIDFCENGQLLKFLQKPENRVKVSASTFRSNLDVVTRLKFADDVCKGMSHLEASKVVIVIIFLICILGFSLTYNPIICLK